MMVPTIHNNGTDGQELLDQVTNAAQALLAAFTAMAAAAPNARDYYVQGDTAAAKAQNEHAERCTKLRSVLNDYRDLAEAIADANDERS